jgi:hypothetical protein
VAGWQASLDLSQGICHREICLSSLDKEELIVVDAKEKARGRIKVPLLLLAISKERGPGSGEEQKGSKWQIHSV